MKFVCEMSPDARASLFMIRVFQTFCLMVILLAQPCHAEGVAQEQSAVQVPPELQAQNPNAWQNIKDFDDTALFAVAGPPTQEDAERAKADTQLYEDMVNNFDDLEDEDDEYLFVIESLFDPEDSSRPASLRMDDNDLDADANEIPSTPNLTSSIYIDTVRPTFFPGFQIKPRPLDLDKKDNTDARSLFADINRPKADDVLASDVKPIIPGTAPESAVPTLPASTKEISNTKQDDKSEKAGKINAPPKQRALSPDEETLGALKQAVKELGLESKLNLGKGAGGHQALENKEEPTTTPTASTAPDVSQQKRTPITAKQRAFMKKKMRKSSQNKRVKPVEVKPQQQPAPPPEEKGLLDDLF